jgi:hypothetical protein
MFILQRPNPAGGNAMAPLGIVDSPGVVSCREVEGHFYFLTLVGVSATMHE